MYGHGYRCLKTIQDLVSFSRVVSNYAADSTPGGHLPSIPSSFSLATILSPEPTNIDFLEGVEGVTKQTTPISSQHGLW